MLHRSRPQPRSLPAYRTLPCPYNGRQVGMCRGLCTPTAGVGACGRVAPHALVGRTQRAIARQAAPPAPSEVLPPREAGWRS